MRGTWSEASPQRVEVFWPTISRGYVELSFPDSAQPTYGAAMWKARQIAEWRNKRWQRLLVWLAVTIGAAIMLFLIWRDL